MLSPPLSFSDISGWAADDHRAALAAFLRHCDGAEASRTAEDAVPFRLGVAREDLLRHCAAARVAAGEGTLAAARGFFETAFTPHRILADGFLTGYFEPEYRGARRRDAEHATPLLRRPGNLVAVDGNNRPAHLPADAPFALEAVDGTLAMPPDRGAIMDGALAGRGLELVWLADPVDAFYVHVQGSARIRLKDGGTMRVGYAGKTGHPYSPIGRVMIERGLAEPGTVTMQVLRRWLAENPDEIDAVLRRNRSYIFFREVTEAGPDDGPLGAAGLPLVAGRSLAVDAGFHAYGTPVFVEAALPAGDGGTVSPFRRLMIAEDTGSAIVGAARGDIFFGSGAEAGELAGRVQHRAAMILLVPRAPEGERRR
jgi:membrane-bound lytic murein transglycosylase A